MFSHYSDSGADTYSNSLTAAGCLVVWLCARPIWGEVAQGLLRAAVLVVYLHSRFKPIAGGFNFDLISRQLSYAIPLGLATLLYWMQLDSRRSFSSAKVSLEQPPSQFIRSDAFRYLSFTYLATRLGRS